MQATLGELGHQFTDSASETNQEIEVDWHSVLVRRDSEFGLGRDVEKRRTNFGELFGRILGPAPAFHPPRVLSLLAINSFALLAWVVCWLGDYGNTAGRRQPQCRDRSPLLFGSENLSTASLRRWGCFPAEPWPPVRRLILRQDQAIVAKLFEASQIFPSFCVPPASVAFLRASDHAHHKSSSGDPRACPAL